MKKGNLSKINTIQKHRAGIKEAENSALRGNHAFLVRAAKAFLASSPADFQGPMYQDNRKVLGDILKNL